MTGLFFSSSGEAEIAVRVVDQRTLYATSWSTALKLASRIMAFGGLGMLFAFTTNSMELVMSLMQQFRLPPKFAYGIWRLIISFLRFEANMQPLAQR